MEINFCLNCPKAILSLPGEPHWAMKYKKFCSLSCAASYNNRRRPQQNKTQSKVLTCSQCGQSFPAKRRTGHCGFVRTRRCDACKGRKDLVWYKTKGELFSTRNNYQSARSTIQKEARRVYFSSGGLARCVVCGYERHVDVAHIKSVASFPADALISLINCVDNLIALCPNHHWEYDHGLLQLA